MGEEREEERKRHYNLAGSAEWPSLAVWGHVGHHSERSVALCFFCCCWGSVCVCGGGSVCFF